MQANQLQDFAVVVMATWSALSGGIWDSGRRVVRVLPPTLEGFPPFLDFFTAFGLPSDTVLLQDAIVDALRQCVRHRIESTRGYAGAVPRHCLGTSVMPGGYAWTCCEGTSSSPR